MKIDLRCILQLLLVVSLLSAGCSDSDSPSDPTGTGPDPGEFDLSDDSQEDAKSAEGIPFKVSRDAKDVEGGWLFYAKSGSSEVPIGEIGFLPMKGTEAQRYQIVFRPTEHEKNLALESWTVDPQSVELKFVNGPRKQLFQGELRDGMLFGNMIGGEGICVPARLVRPAPDVTKIEPTPHRAAGINDFSDVLKEGAEWDDLVKFIEDHPESPLLPNAFYTLFLQTRPREIPVEKIDQLFGLLDRTMSRWGERLKNFVRLNSLLQLSNNYHQPDLLESVYESLQGKFEEDIWKEPVDYFMLNLKKDIELARLVESVHEADQQQRSEILAQLQKEVDLNRYNAKLLVSTAEALTDLEDRQAAIDWYLKLVVVPGLENRYLGMFERFAGELPPPSARLNELWKEVHGSEQDLPETLAREYEKLLSSYELPEFQLPEPNGKQVLIELFTGAACRPCIAADMACSVVRDRLPQDRVVMLQYHVHIPSADPLTCPESAGRYDYYGSKGTPTAVVNGRTFDTLAGDASFVPEVLRLLVDEIVEELSLDPPMQIDLQVNPENNGTATFEVAVTADEISDRWRLHVALAEGEVRFQGQNQIQVHNMVVRKLYTSSQGLEPTGGSLTLEGTIDPEQIRKDLQQSLATHREKNRLEAEDAPLDLDDLFLVAFVQDVRSRRVRQVVSVPVPSPSNVKSDSD